MQFSATSRTTILDEMQAKPLDILIIGGGITGAGIALDAATRGLRVGLVEKNDFGSGTSSRSTKLIHGGLRYLKQMEFALVREVGIERAIVHRLARHLVVPERMLLPIIVGGSLNKYLTSIALWIYDALAGVPNTERRKMITKAQTLRAEPLLRDDILKGGGIYYEYRTDDARLTIEALKTAAQHGALCANYAQIDSFIYNTSGKIIGANVYDHIAERSREIFANTIINAAGPWVDTLRKADGEPAPKKRLHLTKGVHIVVPRERLPVQQAVYFDVPADGRMIFAIPRDKITYIGTTDTDFNENIDAPNANKADVAYLLAATNALFATVQLTAADVVSTWAGLRPLIHEQGKAAGELSRKDEIFVSPSGLVSIAGGKLTGYRKMAERVLDMVIKQLPNKAQFTPCITKTLRLAGGNFDDAAAIEHFILRRSGEAKQAQIPYAVIAEWVGRYGTNTDWLIEKTYELYATIPDIKTRYISAELHYAIEQEMVTSLSDFLIRRSGKLYFDRPALAQDSLLIAQSMAKILHWDESKTLRQLGAFHKQYEAAMAWKG